MCVCICVCAYIVLQCNFVVRGSLIVVNIFIDRSINWLKHGYRRILYEGDLFFVSTSPKS